MKPRLSALLFLFAALAAAQQATISGLVTDPTGAVVPGVSITALNEGTGLQTTAATNQVGQYVIPFLPPGTYSLTAAIEGFKPVERREVKLDVQQVARLDFTLEVESLSQKTTVTADAGPLLSEVPSVASTIAREQIDTLPLNGRDYNQLVLLAGGAVENINSGNGKDFGAAAVNGNRAFSNDYLLDGAPNNNAYQGRSAVPLSIDVIGEFKVTSGVAPAEYGQAGTQVSVVTRGGTNRPHGSLFEYYRGNTWLARDPFNTGARQPFRRDQFGGSLGGPVLRNRTFFFFNYEGNRQTENVTRVATVPPDTFWKGDFSSLLDRKIQLRDPLASGRPVIPDNRLDLYLAGARIQPTAVKLRPFWGSPTRPGLANNVLYFPDQTQSGNQFTLRADHLLPRNHTVAVRYTRSLDESRTPSLLGNASGLLAPTTNHNGTVSWTAPLTARTVSELRFGAAYLGAPTTYNDGGLPTVESLGLRGFEKNNGLVPPMPRITFSGNDAFTQLNYGGNENYGMAALAMNSTTYTANEVVTQARGGHSFKAGFEARRTIFDALQQTDARGRLNFRSSTSGASTGYTFADFLIGLPASTQEVPIKPPVLLKQTELSSFVQDDWRITRSLTLSFGLRHELFLNPYEERNRLAMFDAGTGSIVVASDDGRLPTGLFLPAVVSKLTDAQGNWRFPILSDKQAGFAARRLLETQTNNWGPRFGFGYQLAPRTILRAGYGIFYTRYPRQYLLQTIAVNPPFAGMFNYSQSIANNQPLLTVDAPFPATGASASVSPAGLQRDFGLPSNQQWNLTLERELGWETVGSLGYIGNKGTHLFRSINANANYVDPASGQIVRKYAATYGTSTINFRQTDGNSIYNAMLVEVRRRAKKGVTFQANWTWAKGLDDTGATVNNALLDVQNLGRDRADSDYVRRHQFNFNSTYELPFGRGSSRLLKMVAGGWRLSGIWRYTTGRYFTPTFTASGGLSNNRPDVVPGVRANLARSERSAARWFNPAAFAEVPAVDPASGRARFGNAGRNILVGPGLNVVDASLAKSFPVFRENWRLGFRLEMFNLLNHPNYDAPNANISDVNLVASINRVVRPARQAQFALRFDF